MSHLVHTLEEEMFHYWTAPEVALKVFSLRLRD